MQALVIDGRQVSAQALVVWRRDRHLHHVAGDLQVAGSLLREHLGDHPVDLISRGCGIVDNSLRARELLEHHELRVEAADLVMQEHVPGSLAQAGSPGDHEERHLLRPGPRDGVGDLEPTDAVGHSHHPESLEPGIGIRGERRALLVGRDEQREADLLEIGEEPQGVVADNAEAAIHSPLP